MAGNRLPHRRLPDGSSLFDLLGTGFTVFGGNDAADRLIRALRAVGVPVTSVSDPGILRLLDHSGVLVRPDQHISWAGEHSADVGALIAEALAGLRLPQQRRG